MFLQLFQRFIRPKNENAFPTKPHFFFFFFLWIPFLLYPSTYLEESHKQLRPII
jgi:hypothetical protein